jgi:hypothetical protein
MPKVTFKVYPRNKAPEWLLKKKDKLEKKWHQDNYGKRFIGRIMKACNLPFPNSIVSKGITIVISKHSAKKHGDLVGSTLPTEPTGVSLYARKKDTQRALLSTLCHELVHSLMWSNSCYDNRRRPVSFFADVFADELITTLIEEAMVKNRIRKINYTWALDYACSETFQKMKNLKRTKDYEKVIKELRTFYADSRRSIRQGSNALKERERVLRDVMSPTLDEIS